MRTKGFVTVLALAAGCLPIVGCNAVADRSVTLFTDTTVGFELTFDTKAANPVKAILGYNRSEGLLNPVYGEAVATTYAEDGISIKAKNVDPEFREDAYSVIVKLNSQKQADSATADGTQKGSNHLFITGKAAQLVAQNPAAVAAISNDGNVDIRSASR